jgi:hypothetical protein
VNIVVAILEILAMLGLCDLPIRIFLKVTKLILSRLFLKIVLVIVLIPRMKVSFGREPLIVVPRKILMKEGSLVIILPLFVFLPIELLSFLKRRHSLLEVRLTIVNECCVCLLSLDDQIKHLVLLAWEVDVGLI